MKTDPKRNVRARLGRGESIDLIWLSLGAPAMVELAAATQPGAVVLDLQHGLWDRVSIEHSAGLAASCGAPLLARVAENRAYAISHVLDAGAEGVIVPFIESAEQAAQAVSYARYAPVGRRSSGGTRPMLYGIDAPKTNQEVSVGVMIETMEGVEQVDAIAATPGVDFVFIGPGDLRMTKGARNIDGIRDEIDQVKAACAQRGMPCGIFTTSLDQAAAELAAGFRIIVSGSDFGLAMAGFGAAKRAMEAYR